MHTSTKEDDTIRYHSLHDNKYIRYFKGHKQRVVSFDMSPADDAFISGALDDTVRLWDLRTPNCQGLVNIRGSPCVAFDPSGAVFAIGLDSQTVRLYDIRNFDKGPFAMIPPLDTTQQQQPVFRYGDVWNAIKFSNNGKDMLISTRQEHIYLLDSINCTLSHTLTGHTNQMGLDLEASFTPDGKFVLSGSQDGSIHGWEVATGKKVCELKGHTSSCNVIQMNPKYLQLVSGCHSLAFWIPSVTELQ